MLIPLFWLFGATLAYTIELGIFAGLLAFIASTVIYLVIRKRNEGMAQKFAALAGLLSPIIFVISIILFYALTMPSCEGDPCTTTVRIATA